MNSELEQLEKLEKQAYEIREKLREARRRAPAEPVANYVFKDTDDKDQTLADLFGDRSQLLVVHNMGRSCVYCTLWADGLNGLAAHLADRSAFVLSSPDDPATQREFAESRGWTYPLVSCRDNDFAKDMGFQPEPGKYWPGVSAFEKRKDGTIVRTGRATFGPGDEFCAIWHLSDLLPGEPDAWAPKYAY